MLSVSILTHPEGWALHIIYVLAEYRKSVSILTHPEGWALQDVPPTDVTPREVSILTHPEGWALPRARLIINGATCFNPHPPRRVGATAEEASPKMV